MYITADIHGFWLLTKNSIMEGRAWIGLRQHALMPEDTFVCVDTPDLQLKSKSGDG